MKNIFVKSLPLTTKVQYHQQHDVILEKLGKDLHQDFLIDGEIENSLSERQTLDILVCRKRVTDIWGDRYIERQRDRETETFRHREMERKSHLETERDTYIHKQTDRQTGCVIDSIDLQGPQGDLCSTHSGGQNQAQKLDEIIFGFLVNR